MVEVLALAKPAKFLILAAVEMNLFVFSSGVKKGWIRECRLLSLAFPNTLIGLCACPQGARQRGAPPPSLPQREGDSSACECSARSPCTNIKFNSLTHSLAFLFFSFAGSELHSLPAGRLHKVRPAPRLDSLQPRAPGQHWWHRLHGQRHAHETQVHLGLAVTRCGKNAGNPIKERVIVSLRGFQ